MIIEKINLNFILDYSLWDDKIDKMRKYIKLKYIVFCYNKDLLTKEKHKNIDDEITYLEKIIKDNNFNIDKKEIIIKQKEKNENIEKKIEKSKKEELSYSNDDFIEDYKHYESLSSEELRKLIHVEKIPEDLRKIIFSILLDRIKRK